jgi:hypothetical protein
MEQIMGTPIFTMSFFTGTDPMGLAAGVCSIGYDLLLFGKNRKKIQRPASNWNYAVPATRCKSIIANGNGVVKGEFEKIFSRKTKTFGDF